MNHCNDGIKPLLKQLLKLKESIKNFENTKHMTFMLEEKHKGIVNKQSEIWNRFEDLIGKDFDG